MAMSDPADRFTYIAGTDHPVAADGATLKAGQPKNERHDQRQPRSEDILVAESSGNLKRIVRAEILRQREQDIAENRCR